MNDESEFAPLPAEVESLLDHERARLQPPPEVTDRMYGRLAVALGLPPSPGGGPSGSGGAPSATGAPPAADPGNAAGGVDVAALAGASVGAGAGLSKTAVVVAVAFAAGAVAGSVTTHLLRDDAPPTANAEVRGGPATALRAREPAVTPVTREQPETDDSPTPPAPSRPSIDRKPAASRGVRHSEDVSDPRGISDRRLAAERALVERARSALVRSRPADALAALRQHQKTFPDGELAEEREAIRVLALAADGEHDAARESARRFRKRYPRSLLLPTVDAAVTGRPQQMADREKPKNLK